MAVLQLIRGARTTWTWRSFIAGVLSLARPARNVLCTPKNQPPNYAAWRHVDRFSVRQAAHLWCDIDPNESATLEIKIWCQAFTSALKRGELKYENLSGKVLLTRETLKEFAEEHGYDPVFLR